MSRVPTLQPLVLALLVGLLAVLLPATAGATTDTGQESAFLAAIDRERASRGLTALRRAGDLTTVARRHSVRMADRGALSHNPDLGSEVSGWETLGENVGRGPDAGTIHAAFMDSPSHRDNILDARFVEVGVGVERRDDVVWVTQIFRVPASEPQPEPEPAPAPPPDPGPEPSPGPTATAAPRAPASGTPATRSTPPDGRRTGTTSGPAPEAGVGPAITSPIAAAPPPPPVVDRLTVTLAGIEATEDDRLTVAGMLDLP